MPKSIADVQQQSTVPSSSLSKGYNLRSGAAKSFPHESRSVVFLGVSRRPTDVKKARQRIRQQRVILLAVSKKQVNLSPGGALRLVSKRKILVTTVASANGTGDTSSVVATAKNHQSTEKTGDVVGPSTSAPPSEEVQCLFFNCCDESDATPRSDSNALGRCRWTTPIINCAIDVDDVTHVSGPADANGPPVPAPCPASVYSYLGQPTVFGQLTTPLKRVRSECGDLHAPAMIGGSVEDAFFNDFLRDIRQSRI